GKFLVTIKILFACSSANLYTFKSRKLLITRISLSEFSIFPPLLHLLSSIFHPPSSIFSLLPRILIPLNLRHSFRVKFLKKVASLFHIKLGVFGFDLQKETVL